MNISQIPWIERTFNFCCPVGLYPVLLERLIGTPARLEEMVDSNLSEELLCLKTGGRWSVKEQIGHLADLDVLHDGRIDDYLSGKTMLRAADMQNKTTSDAGHNTKSIEVLLKSFRDSRMRFVKRLDSLDDSLSSVVSIHPRLQARMSLTDMLLFICEHDDHHLAKIRTLISSAG